MKKLFLFVAIVLAFVACKTEASDSSPTMWKVTVNPNGATGLTQLEYEVKDGDTLAALSNTPTLPAQYVVLAGYQDDLKAEFILGQTAVKRNMTIKMLWKTDPSTDCTGVDYTDTNFFKAAYYGTVLTLACAKLASVNMDKSDVSKATALISAARGEGIESIKYLVAIGADVSLQDDSGQTALINAAAYARIDAVKYLLEQGGANIKDKDNGGQTALMLAASDNREPKTGDRLKTVQYLATYNGIDLSARVNSVGFVYYQNMTALGIAEYLYNLNPTDAVYKSIVDYLKPIYAAAGIDP